MTIKNNVVIDTLNNKLKIENGQFVFTKTSVEYVLRKVTQILETCIGEDFQAPEKGLDLQGVIFNNRISSSDISAEILRNVLLVEEVERVENINITQDEEELSIIVQFIYNEELLEVNIDV